MRRFIRIPSVSAPVLQQPQRQVYIQRPGSPPQARPPAPMPMSEACYVEQPLQGYASYPQDYYEENVNYVYAGDSSYSDVSSYADVSYIEEPRPLPHGTGPLWGPVYQRVPYGQHDARLARSANMPAQHGADGFPAAAPQPQKGMISDGIQASAPEPDQDVHIEDVTELSTNNNEPISDSKQTSHTAKTAQSHHSTEVAPAAVKMPAPSSVQKHLQSTEPAPSKAAAKIPAPSSVQKQSPQETEVKMDQTVPTVTKKGESEDTAKSRFEILESQAQSEQSTSVQQKNNSSQVDSSVETSSEQQQPSPDQQQERQRHKSVPYSQMYNSASLNALYGKPSMAHTGPPPSRPLDQIKSIICCCCMKQEQQPESLAPNAHPPSPKEDKTPNPPPKEEPKDEVEAKKPAKKTVIRVEVEDQSSMSESQDSDNFDDVPLGSDSDFAVEDDSEQTDNDETE